MALVDDLRNLADRSLIELTESHDYYTFTKRVWELIGKERQEGR